MTAFTRRAGKHAAGKNVLGTWFGMLTDKFGIQCMVNHDYTKK